MEGPCLPTDKSCACVFICLGIGERLLFLFVNAGHDSCFHSMKQSMDHNLGCDEACLKI